MLYTVIKVKLYNHHPGADPALELGEGHYEEMGKFFVVRPLRLSENVGNAPFCFTLDHLSHRLMFIPPENKLAVLCKT